MKINNGIALKASIATSLFTLCLILTTLYEPVIGAKFAIDQLNDDYSSHVGVKLWFLFKDNWFIGYVFFVLVLFANNIKNLITKAI